MARKATKPALLIIIGAFVVLAVLATFQHAARGEPADKMGVIEEKTGDIEGTVEHDLIEADAAVVYLKEFPGEFPPPKEPPSMALKKLSFNPKILAVVVGTTVRCPNNDTVTHNIFSPTKSAKTFNFGLYPPGSTQDLVFNKVGVAPFRCNIHAEMSGYVVVLPNQYFAKTEKDGKFKIENVPPGKYQLSFWHEKLRAKKIDVVISEGRTKNVTFTDLERGKYSIELTK